MDVDVDAAAAAGRAARHTPVPGGAGPVTTALLRNVVTAARAAVTAAAHA